MEPRAFMVQRSGHASPGPERWPLAAEVVSVGRGDDSDIVIADREISRRHAQIRHDGTRYVLADLGSKNGTRVNGRVIERAVPLADGDEVVFGTQHAFRFVDHDATVAAAARDRGVRVDADRRSVRVNGHAVEPPLAPNQFALLELLAGQPGRVFSRDEIAEACYPNTEAGVSDQAIDGIVRRLRGRLAEADADTEYITAVRGHGFRLNPTALA